MQEIESGLAKIIKEIINSPEARYISEMGKKAQDELPIVLEQFVKEIVPYADMARQFTVNVAPYLLQMAQISAELRVYALAGEAEYVIWEVLPKTFMEEAYNVQSKEALLELIRQWIHIFEKYEYWRVDTTWNSISGRCWERWKRFMNSRSGFYRGCCLHIILSKGLVRGIRA